MRGFAGNKLAPMPLPGRSPLALALAIVAMGLGACGSGDEEGTIPASNAEAMLATLAQVEENVNNGDCTSAQTDAQQFVTLVDGLPKEVGESVKADLREAGDNLVSKTQDPEQCQQPEDDTEPPPDTGASGVSGVEEADG